MIDAHCHLDDPRLEDSLPELLYNAKSLGIRMFVTAGYSPSRWPKQWQLAQEDPAIVALYGLHPWFVAQEDPISDTDRKDSLVQILAQKELYHPVGIGECGLDRSHRVPSDSWERQCSFFRFQLALAREYELPVALHVVKAHNELISLLKKDGIPKKGGMIHGFSGSKELAEAYTQLGLHLSFGGQITFPNAKKVRESAAHVEERWLLCETDAPDRKPFGANTTYNEPSMLVQVVQTLAFLRGTTTSSMAAITESNASSLFDL